MKCSFTYDFSLHDSLVTWWSIDNGSDSIQHVTKGDRTTNDSAVDRLQEEERIVATGVRGRAIFLHFPYRKVSTIYLSLTIKSALVQDSGVYKCNAKTRLDTAASNSAKIQILHRTELLKTPKDISAVLNGEAKLSCNLIIDPSLVEDAEVYWTRNNRPTSFENTKIVPGQEDHKFELIHTLSNVNEEDTGQYKCHVITSYDSVHSGPAKLKLMSATVITRHPSSVVAVHGGVAQFRCKNIKILIFLTYNFFQM